jgi:hypothetical protein
MEESLMKLVERSESANFFLDEVPFGSRAISANFLNKLSEKIPENLYLWAACQAHESHYTEGLKGLENK